MLRLSRGMTYKAAVAGVELGGGKAVILGDPAVVKTPRRRWSAPYGRFVERLGGRYITAGDVGTNSNDLDVIGETTDHVVGRNASAGGSGDSGPQTAFGVFQSMRAAAAAVWGTPTLAGRTVGVEGAGKVGSALVSLLVEDGATVLVSDVNPAAARSAAAHERATVVDSVDSVIAHRLDVYAPCALGATLHEESVAALTAEIVCEAEQPAAHPRRRVPAAGARHRLGAGLRRQRRRPHPGRGRTPRPLRRGRPGEDRRRLPHRHQHLRTRRARRVLLGAAADRLAEERIAAAR